MTAAETAVLRQGRSIVIIESDSTAAAHWIAAISFLLPPDVARRMSFATYRHRPEYATAHVVATLPESDFDLDESSFHSYVVFDAASGRISELAPDPAAALLVRAGAERAALLWERTAELIDRPPVALAEGYPLLVAAAILEHLPVVDAELEVLADWLESNPGIQLEDDVRLFPPLRRAALLARCRSTLVRPTTQPYLAAPAQPINPASPTGPTSPTGPVDSMGSTSDWLVRALLEPARDGAYLPVYLALCQGIDDGTLSERLPPPAHQAVSSFLSVVRDLERVRTEPEDAKVISLRTLAGSYSQQPVTVQDLLRAALPEQIDELVGSPHLAGVVASWPGDIVTAYLEAAARQLAHRPTDAAAAARLFETLQALHSGQETVLAPALAEELRKGLRTWSQNELDQLQDQLRQKDSRLSTRFTEWRDQHLGGILSRSLRRLALRRSRTGAGE